jgi:hypothetical protein
LDSTTTGTTSTLSTLPTNPGSAIASGIGATKKGDANALQARLATDMKLMLGLVLSLIGILGWL